MSDLPSLRSTCGGPTIQELRRLDTGELNDLEAHKMRGHVNGCSTCLRVLQEFESDRATLRHLLPFGALEARLQNEGSVWSRIRKQLALGLLVPLAAAAAFFLAPVSTPDSPATEGPAIRSKGGGSSGATLDFFVQAAAGPRSGTDGEALKAGDQIRLRYGSGENPYVLIVGVDADGRVFPYVVDGDRSARTVPGQALAPNAIVLDADPRPERVFAFYSQEPIAVDEVKPVAKDAVLSVGGHIEKLMELPMKSAVQRSLLINKAAR